MGLGLRSRGRDDLYEGLGGLARDRDPLASVRLRPAKKVVPVTRTSKL